MAKKIVLVTTSRSDYGACYWLIHDLFADKRFELQLVVGGSHLAAAHGGTVAEIESDGWPIAARIPFPGGPSEGSAAALAGLGAFFATRAVDMVLLYGDRYELLPIASAALLTSTPLGHLCGGDLTLGVFDDQVRHAVSKLAHLHFPSSAEAANRIGQLGEEPWRVHLAGDPALDHFRRGRVASALELEQTLGFRPDRETLLVTYHPPTLELEDLPRQMAEFQAALEVYPGPAVITGPNADPGGDRIRETLRDLSERRPRTAYVESLGSVRYRGLQRVVGAMLGNSSSGLNEAPLAALPVVNVGSRQQGRVRGANVIDVTADRAAITRGLARALDPGFRESLKGASSPYGDGDAARRVVAVLADLPDRERLLRKGFVDLVAPGVPSTPALPRPPALGGGMGIDLSDLDDLSQPSSQFAATFFATAREALGALAASAPGRWLVPDFICPVVPEALRPWAELEAYPWLDPWTPDLDALRRRVEGAAGVVVPFYLGLEPPEDLWHVLRGQGLRVVEDRCQWVGRPPLPASLRGDFAVGSLRKWLPVPDGAYCVAARGTPPTPKPHRLDRMVALRLAATLLQGLRASLPSDDGLLEDRVVRLFQEGEEAADRDLGSHTASRIALHLLERLDMGALLQARLRNQSWLAERLQGVPGVELPKRAATAALQGTHPLLALPVLSSDRDRVLQKLKAARIYAPVHWRDGDWSGSGGLAAAWAARVLSLPIDQRYDPEQLIRIVTALNA